MLLAMKIRYVRENDNILKVIKLSQGDWLDLATAEDVTLTKGDFYLISLGVRIQLPKGFEAHLVPRSSTFKKWGIMQGNSIGIIDNSYQGRKDIWKFPAYAIRKTSIPKATRICQFRIVPSMNAGFWVKLKWLFTKKVEFVEEEYISDENSSRGGFGSTGN